MSHLGIPPSVADMFEGRSVFITGASGFIGRVLLEKLLRSYQGIERIYILLRTKKNQQPHERLHNQLLKVPIFDKIRAMPNGTELLSKIVVIPGDIGEPELGISESDLKKMLADESLSIVFHSAATIKFDEPLKVSVKLNLIATKTVIDICRKLKNLVSFCHVSTAYVNSHFKDNRNIEEKLYPMKDNPHDLIKMAEVMSESLMQQVKSTLVDQRPNTYTYTKALAEHLIALEAGDLPVAIVRPTIVAGGWQEPLPGWIDNLNGPTGVILAIGKGLLRTLYCKRAVKAEIIPVDVVVNAMIAAAYYAARVSDIETLSIAENSIDSEQNGKTPISNGFCKLSDIEPDIVSNGVEVETKNHSKNSAKITQGANGCQVNDILAKTNNNNLKEINMNSKLSKESAVSVNNKDIPIFHINSGDINPITWATMEDEFFPTIRKYPSQQVFRYPFGTFKSNYYHDLITRLLVHYLPALIIDLLCFITGKKRQLLSIYRKLHSATGALAHFTTHNYNFKSQNIKLLRSKLSQEDQKELFMDIENLVWPKYLEAYVLGARRYILKEKDESLPDARKSFKRAYHVEMVLRGLLVLLVSLCCLPMASRLISSHNQSLGSPTTVV